MTTRRCCRAKCELEFPRFVTRRLLSLRLEMRRAQSWNGSRSTRLALIWRNAYAKMLEENPLKIVDRKPDKNSQVHLTWEENEMPHLDVRWTGRALLCGRMFQTFKIPE